MLTMNGCVRIEFKRVNEGFMVSSKRHKTRYKYTCSFNLFSMCYRNMSWVYCYGKHRQRRSLLFIIKNKNFIVNEYVDI